VKQRIQSQCEAGVRWTYGERLTALWVYSSKASMGHARMSQETRSVAGGYFQCAADRSVRPTKNSFTMRASSCKPGWGFHISTDSVGDLRPSMRIIQ
jgi:hypothetical protein